MTDGEALNSGNHKMKKWNEEKGNENKNKKKKEQGEKNTQKKKVIKDANTDKGGMQ
jgi:hypothetical protein